METLGKVAKRVLIAEDDDHVREVLQETLSGAGYQVIATENGLEALEWLTRMPVDLIIADILMPGLSGPELITRLRQRSEWATIPVLVLSAYADLTRYQQLPVENIQLKPVRLADLLDKVRQMIGPPSM